MSTMPAQKPGRSFQNYQTDPRLIAAVVRRFGPLVLDLAASADNTQAPLYFDEEFDSLKQNWQDPDLPAGNRWLNPPFGDIGRWAAKCVESAGSPNRIIFHVPASVGANWYRDFVHRWAAVLFLNGRVTYVGQTQPFPKDCLIAVYGDAPGCDVWSWMKDEST